jgi:hypothetical protein
MDIDDDPDERYFHKMGLNPQPDSYDRERTMDYPTDTKQFPGYQNSNSPREKPKNNPKNSSVRFDDRTPSHDSHRGTNNYHSKNIENFMEKKPKMHRSNLSGSKRYELKQLEYILRNEIEKQKCMEEKIDEISTADRREGGGRGRMDFVGNFDGDCSVVGIGRGVSPIRNSRWCEGSRSRDRDGGRLSGMGGQHSQPQN